LYVFISVQEIKIMTGLIIAEVFKAKLVLLTLSSKLFVFVRQIYFKMQVFAELLFGVLTSLYVC